MSPTKTVRILILLLDTIPADSPAFDLILCAIEAIEEGKGAGVGKTLITDLF